MQDLSRRMMLAASAVLPWATGSAAADVGKAPLFGSSTLVAYFTRSGNTRVIAATLHRELKADLFEILPAQPYPEDYEQTVAQADGETKRGYEPPLTAAAPRFAFYDTVMLGLPVWGMTVPPVLRSFLHAHNWSGKTIRPFITHGGYGVGNSMDVIHAHAPGAVVADPFVMEADQERRTLTQVRGWLASIQPG